VEAIVEAIACKLSGHTICSMCGDCVPCNIASNDNFTSPGHIAFTESIPRYRCNNTYMERNDNDDIHIWWHDASLG